MQLKNNLLSSVTSGKPWATTKISIYTSLIQAPHPKKDWTNIRMGFWARLYCPN